MNRHDYPTHQYWMQRAIALAQQAGAAGEVPVGAVIIDSAGRLIATGENRRERDHDPTAHAEVVALRAAGRSRQSWHLTDCTLYVTLEPCPMCTGAILLARLGFLVYGADDPKTGTIRTVLNLPDSPCSNHHLAVLPGILEESCRDLLHRWFEQHRTPKQPPIKDPD